MKLVYIASPYHANTPEEMERNRQAAHAACEEAYRLGRLNGIKIIPVTPIGNFPYLDDNKPDERAQALHMGIALLSKCDELWVAGGRVSEGMKGEIRAAVRMEKPVYSMGLEQQKIQNAIFDMLPMLDEKSCFKDNDRRDYTGQLLVLKLSALAPWSIEPENQLWTAYQGFGTRPDAGGRAVYAKNLFDGEETRFDRADFYGIADPSRLPDWAQKAFDEYQQQNSEYESEEQDL
jgi:hypothetical protein